jgi:hypothetical protein
MSKENTDADGGYNHFHESGRKRPQSVASGIPWRNVDHGPGMGSTGPGIDPKTGMPKAQSNVPGGSVGGEAKKLGIT